METWRLYIFKFVLNDYDNRLPDDHPVKLEVTDPEGKLVFKKTLVDHVDRFYTFPFATTTESMTGIYKAKVSVRSKISEKSESRNCKAQPNKNEARF